MVWPVIAAGIGLAGSLYSSSKASSSANKAAKLSAEADAERLAFEREQYDEWQATYGPIEDNLAKYYNDLTPTMRTTQGLEAFQKEMDTATTKMHEDLAQRGIDTSGISVQLDQGAAMHTASERARIRAAAPMEVAKEKASFLQIGLGQDPSGGVSDALSDAQRNASRTSDITARNAGVASSAVVDSLTDLAQAGAKWWENRDT